MQKRADPETGEDKSDGKLFIFTSQWNNKPMAKSRARQCLHDSCALARHWLLSNALLFKPSSSMNVREGETEGEREREREREKRERERAAHFA
jgi:hypothetical protein